MAQGGGGPNARWRSSWSRPWPISCSTIPRFDTVDFSSVSICSVGSAPLAPFVVERLQERMPDAMVSNNYGMTEAGSAYCTMPKGEAVKRPGSVGTIAPPAVVRIVDADDEPLPPDEVGEVRMQLPGRHREYFEDPEATAEMWKDGWLVTGDLGRLDDEGYLYIVGRSKDVIIRGGNNIHAADVEHVLVQHADVAEVAVVGSAHPVLGEDVVAFVVLHRGRRCGRGRPARLRAGAAGGLQGAAPVPLRRGPAPQCHGQGGQGGVAPPGRRRHPERTPGASRPGPSIVPARPDGRLLGGLLGALGLAGGGRARRLRGATPVPTSSASAGPTGATACTSVWVRRSRWGWAVPASDGAACARSARSSPPAWGDRRRGRHAHGLLRGDEGRADRTAGQRGAARVPPGQACPQFILLWQVRVVIASRT